MSSVLRITLIVSGINLFVVVLLVATQNAMDAFISIGLIWIFSLILQLLIGLILVLQQRYREAGKGILLGALLGLVVGFSVCSIAAQ